ncbi:MAG: class C beta-lactamase-related serine hydrolase [Clostridia bacterium]|nr:class C beta-lactamase-related serine hydrolase [Clostridia bacterium]
MDLQVINSSISLVRHIFDSRESTVSRIETVPDKPAFADAPIESPFPRATPESKGIPSGVIADYFRRLSEKKELDMHSVTVIKDGAVVAETDFGAYDRRVWHITYSACKSVTGLAIGMLVDEGKLSLGDKVVRLLEDHAPKLALLTMKDLTVRHLLTMTSGVAFNEAGAVTETDWVRGFLESTILGEPGTKFNYNSMNTYMLSAIVREISGKGLSDFLRPRLWEPLGITEVFWEKCPKGIEKGGWGLYIRQEDFAKIGQLILQQGKWNGKKLISEEWVEAATRAQIETPGSYGGYNYGFQIWVGRKNRSFLFNGMFGQNIMGYKDSGIIVASNAGVDEMFQSSEFYPITNSFFGREFSGCLPEDGRARDELLALLNSFDAKTRTTPEKRGLFQRRESPLPEQCGLLAGKVYDVNSPNRVSVGLLPLAMQALQNVYTKGVVSFSFSMEKDRFFMTVDEADESYKLPIGFAAPEYTELDFHGEPHKVGVTGRFAEDEDGRLVLICRVSFIESAGARHIKLYFEPGLSTLEARFKETPGRPFLENGLDMLTEEIKVHPVISNLLGRASQDYINYKLSTAFEPVLKASERRASEPEIEEPHL